MSNTIRTRWFFALFGAAAGYAFWLLANAADQSQPSGRLLMIAIVALIVCTGGFFAMAGTLRVPRAAGRALALAALVSGLTWLVSLRWDWLPDMFWGPTHFIALFAVSVLPLPFMLAQGQGDWRNYPALFDIAWEILTRGLVAVFFAGAVWLVIGLSALLLNMVGITLIEDLVERDGVPFLISGAAFGLAVAVVNELSSMLSPRLIHWLLRLLLPLVTLVSGVFVVAVVVRGYGAGLSGLSPSLVLLSIAASGITLVTVTLDADEESASRSPLILWSARGMVVLLPVLAGLSLRAIWLRIDQQGLTPNRLFVLVLALVALAYGLAYLAALFRGRAFAEGVRRANPWLALGVILCAVLWLTPLFNAEAISARDQANRIRDGRKPAEEADWRLFSGLGYAGNAARESLRAEAMERNETALAERLDPDFAAPELTTASKMEEQLASLKAVLPVQPASATGTRDMFLSTMSDWQLDAVYAVCNAPATDPANECLMVVADMLTERPGEEALLIMSRPDYAEAWGLTIDEVGQVQVRSPVRAGGGSLSSADLKARLAQWREAPPPLAPARINQLGSGDEGVLFLP